ELTRPPRVARPAPWKIPTQVVIGPAAFAREQAAGDRARHRGIGARREHAELARARDERSGIERARIDERSERIADTEADERAFVPCTHIEIGLRAGIPIAPSSHVCNLLVGFRNGRPASRPRALAPQLLQTRERVL